MNALRRTLGKSDLTVSSIGLGCWPIAGVSSLDVNDNDSLATIHAAIDSGINFIDTAFSYGFDGESDRLLAQVLRSRREDVILASKVGSHYTPQQERVVDGRPEVLLEHTRLSLQRLGVEQVDVMYLHQLDPRVPLQESAGGLQEVIDRQWARYAGVSNVNAQQLAEFDAICPVVVVQPPFNMLQQEQVQALRDYCLQQNIGIACYWALMKGLLAGKMDREHQLDPRDRRLSYDIYQGEKWHRAQDLLDELRRMAVLWHCSVSQLVLAWTIAQPGITAALCGAKRPDQIRETAAAMELVLPIDAVQQIDRAIAATQQVEPSR